MYKLQISSIFNFDRAHQSWISGVKIIYITMALVTTPVCPRAAPRAKPGKINLKKIEITFKLKQV